MDAPVDGEVVVEAAWLPGVTISLTAYACRQENRAERNPTQSVAARRAQQRGPTGQRGQSCRAQLQHVGDVT